MQQMLQCRLLICKGQDKSIEETAQQQMVSRYSKQIQFKNQNIMDKPQSQPSNSKDVFSFKLNSFRNYDESDKTRTHLQNYVQNSSEIVNKLQNCRSTEKKPQKLAQCYPINHQANVRFYCSPPSKPLTTLPKNPQKTSVMFKSPSKQQTNPQISFKINNNKVYYSQANDIKSKQSEQTEYSQKKSQTYHQHDQKKQILFQHYGKNFFDEAHYFGQGATNGEQNLRKAMKPTEFICPHLGNETERTLIDGLNEEQYKQKQVSWHPLNMNDNHISTVSHPINQAKYLNLIDESRIPNLRNHHHQTIRLSSPIHHIATENTIKPMSFTDNSRQIKTIHSIGEEIHERQAAYTNARYMQSKNRRVVIKIA